MDNCHIRSHISCMHVATHPPIRSLHLLFYSMPTLSIYVHPFPHSLQSSNVFSTYTSIVYCSADLSVNLISVCVSLLVRRALPCINSSHYPCNLTLLFIKCFIVLYIYLNLFLLSTQSLLGSQAIVQPYNLCRLLSGDCVCQNIGPSSRI